MWFTMGGTWIYCMWPSQNNRDRFLYKDNLGHSWGNWKSKIWVSHLFCFCGLPPPHPGWVTIWQKSRTRNCRIQKRPNWLVSLYNKPLSWELVSSRISPLFSPEGDAPKDLHQTLHFKGWTFSEPGHAGRQASRKQTCGGHSYSRATAGGKKEKRRVGWRKKG